MSNSVEIAQVECPECAGIGAVEDQECPVCDGHGSVEGEAHTISLHNIRYELVWRGDDLWRIGDGREELVGNVRPVAEGRRWKPVALGYPVESFEDKRTARAVVEAAVRGPGEPVY